MKPLRVGILGLGQRGLQHLGVLWRLQEQGVARVAALADAFPVNLAPEKIARFVPGYRPEGRLVTTEFDRLLADGDLDALVVSIPPGRHDGEVIRAARAGVHLFVEKPVSLSLAEAAQMARSLSRKRESKASMKPQMNTDERGSRDALTYPCSSVFICGK